MNRKLLASAICASLFVAGSAFAQNNPAPAQQTQGQSQTNQQTKQSSSSEQPKLKTLETMTITGSLLKRPEYQTTVPVQVIDIQASLAAGAFSTVNLLQSTAIAMGSTQINNQFSGFVVGGGIGIETIDLRGLGSNRTLVLMDGQRPGPAGSQGKTGIGFDLNVVPDVILQRIEIVKDGSSSIYGSDAVAGVVNLITKKQMDGTQLKAFWGVPQHGGGQQITASIGHGFNFDKGNILVAAQFSEQLPLALKDRNYFKCAEDLIFGPDGKRIDRADHSITAGTPLSGCNNLYANTVLKFSNPNIRYVPSTDGSTVGPFPGYHPRPFPAKTYANNPQGGAYYEDVLNFPFYGNAWAINKNRNSSFYASSRFDIGGGVSWTNQFLYNHRQTNTEGWRQFFPVVNLGGPYTGVMGKPTAAQRATLYQPIMPFPSNNAETVNWYYFKTGLEGGFGDSSWSWQANATYTKDSAYYSHVGIDNRLSGDVTKADNTLRTPPVDYFDPAILSGQNMGALIDAVGLFTRGHTTYKQTDVNFVATGNLFTLPAGDVAAAAGAEFRQYAINDRPDANNSAGHEWGFSSAQVTKGSDHVYELFGEVGVPLLANKPGVNLLSIDMSARTFKYASVANPSRVWKFGLNWQIVPEVKVRGTIGTSFRAPQLYELYLGNLSGFQSQTAIDPCVEWATNPSINDFTRANCAKAGIPGDYNGAGASAQIFQGGGKGFLSPETSRAKTLGVVWTPSFAPLNMALDYFDYHIRNEIGTLSAATIVTACYNRPVFPNAFCSLLSRNPPNAPTDPNRITDIHATFININQQRQRGYDLQANYTQDFSFGKIMASAQVTYTISDITQLFSTSAASGFNNSDRIGFIGSPQWTGVFNAAYKRGDWTFNWQGRYFETTREKDISDHFTYLGFPNAFRLIKADWAFYHDVSVTYDRDKWGITGGVRNLLDEKPSLISTGVDTRRGNTPLNASQYDIFGRTFFVRANYKF